VYLQGLQKYALTTTYTVTQEYPKVISGLFCPFCEKVIKRLRHKAVSFAVTEVKGSPEQPPRSSKTFSIFSTQILGYARPLPLPGKPVLKKRAAKGASSTSNTATRSSSNAGSVAGQSNAGGSNEGLAGGPDNNGGGVGVKTKRVSV